MKQELWCKVSKDDLKIKVPIGKGIAGYVAKTAKSVNIPDAYKDERY